MKNGKRKIFPKILLSVAMMGALGVCVWVLGALFSHEPIVAQAAEVGSGQSVEQMQAEISELRALIQSLLQSLSGQQAAQPAQQAGIPTISSQQARDLAFQFVGSGTVGESLFFSENGVPMFEVEVITGNIRYTVHINGETGHLVRMSRSDVAPPVTPVAPIAPIPPIAPITPVPTPPATNWSSPNWSSPSPGGSWGSASPGGWGSASPGGWGSSSPRR
ncbi:MAG: PepSY domain-containing protein [Defluviitaleaceae bacterium]|nr:PepSY domain-containing protein [Defluviitaleaceae bacterium]